MSVNVRRVIRTGALTCALSAVLLGCGGGDDEDDSPRTIAATKVCDGRLSSSAATSVEFLTGEKRLSPIGNGRADASLAKAASALSDGYVPGEGSETDTKPACLIVNPEGGSPDLQIGFGITSAKAADGPAADTFATYEVGRTALIGIARSYLYFDCVSPKLDGSTHEKPAIVFGKLTNHAEGLGRYEPAGGPDQVRAANLTLLHSLSLSMAEELGCAGGAGLDARLPPKPATAAKEEE
ncbi:hypothetical protein [Streptomyces sp. NBC_00370]|uniref:hypothetical protein n=1 Tax=Streptomyces sp. NBC_00370 TaxID=2975728 RepID=UPI002E25DD6A